MSKLQDKVVVITGGISGIGKASDDSSFMTTNTLTVDGGYTAQ